jgi:hypothetical protein
VYQTYYRNYIADVTPSGNSLPHLNDFKSVNPVHLIWSTGALDRGPHALREEGVKSQHNTFSAVTGAEIYSVKCTLY